MKTALWSKLFAAVYSGLLYLFLPLVMLFAWKRCRKITDPLIKTNNCWLARFGLNQTQIPPGGIWIHAVSVGETRSIFPLLEKIHHQHPKKPIILTSGSTQGALQALKFAPVPVYHQMIPYDYPFAIHRFLNRIQPSLVLMVETEIWPNLYQACEKRNIPLMLINARLKRASFQAYLRWAKPLMRYTLDKTKMIACQFETDRERFIQLGAQPDKTQTVGNLKFDIQIPSDLSQNAQNWRAQLKDSARFIWVAASTHAEEEALMLQAHQKLLKTCPDALLILVPRHADRFDEVALLLQTPQPITGLTWQRHSCYQTHNTLDSTQVYLADSMGELMHWFAVSDAAFIGGSMVNFGGHNILEPAALTKPVLSGPYFQNLEALYQSFIDQQALQVCATPDELGTKLIEFAQNQTTTALWGTRALNALKLQTGSLSRHYALIKPYLS